MIARSNEDIPLLTGFRLIVSSQVLPIPALITIGRMGGMYRRLYTRL